MRSSLDGRVEWQAVRPLLGDAGVLTLLAGLLIAVHALVPPSLQAQLAFDHQAVAPWMVWTHAYVHTDWTHLLTNVAGYLSLGAVAYVLCRRLDARRWFWLTTAAFVVLLPVFVSLSSYVVLGWIGPATLPPERGFSGVVAGFAGFVFVAFLLWVSREAGLAVTQAAGQGVILLMLWELSVIYAGWEEMLLSSGLIAGGLGLSWVLIFRAVSWPDVWTRRDAWWAELSFAVGIVVVLLTAVVALFPAELVSGGMFTNIFAHAAGFLWGGFGAAAARLLLHHLRSGQPAQTL